MFFFLLSIIAKIQWLCVWIYAMYVVHTLYYVVLACIIIHSYMCTCDKKFHSCDHVVNSVYNVVDAVHVLLVI